MRCLGCGGESLVRQRTGDIYREMRYRKCWMMRPEKRVFVRGFMHVVVEGVPEVGSI
jgi:hypothetical protein